MVILISTAVAVIYVIIHVFWNKKVKWRLPIKAAQAFRFLHFTSLALTLFVAVLSQFSLGLRGLWTTRTFIITFLISGIFFLFLVSKERLKKVEVWYFKAFSFFPVVIAMFLWIPFLGIVLFLSLFGRLISPADDVFYEDDKIRVQSTFIGALGPPATDIYEKIGLFEKHLKRRQPCAIDADSVSVIYRNDFTKVILYDSEYRSEPCEIMLDKLK